VEPVKLATSVCYMGGQFSTSRENINISHEPPCLTR